MKLPSVDLSFSQKLDEFDIWLTPSLGEITDTDTFHQELENIVQVFDLLGRATQNFSQPDRLPADFIAETFVNETEDLSDKERQALFEALASTLYLVTGKSDNQAKCQFPLYLRDVANWDTLTDTRGRGDRQYTRTISLPRELKAERYMRMTARSSDSEQQKRMLAKFIAFILSHPDHASQLWSLGHGYHALKAFDKERDLLAPLVIFKVRGSVMASLGHKPEAILRERLQEMGLRPGIDFNLADVVVIEKEYHRKTRGYDFVLPYRTPEWQSPWENRLFIQCQFYAGDSGSVSHKNIDQAQNSRADIQEEYRRPVFVEYVDGAGYFSSLNSDLKRLLRLPDTDDFFQIRSAPIRLRRALQALGYLTPLEIEHAILCSDGTPEQVERHLVSEGYVSSEVRRTIQEASEQHLIIHSSDRLEVHPDRRTTARRYFLLDIIANFGKTIQASPQALNGHILIPGYGPFFGMRLSKLVQDSTEVAPALKDDWRSPDHLLQDIEWITSHGFAISR
jgi:hypothetical protein